jgi:hypothetical protein
VAIPLKDFRTGITESIDLWLDAVAASNHIDKAQVARDVLQEWADKKDYEHTIASRRKMANGTQTDLPGFELEDAGRPRRARR